MRRSRRSVLAALALATTLTAGIAPSFVSAGSSNYGATFRCGFKSVNIDENDPGMRLKRFVVGGPTQMFGREPNQQVGWQLIVQRRYDDNNVIGKSKRVFTGSIERSIATPTEPATFTSMTAKIGYVDSIDAWPDGKHTEFRTVLRFFWFGDDGSIERERFVGGTYHSYLDGNYVWDEQGSCQGAYVYD